MSALAEVLGNSAPGHPFVYDGKTYAVSLVDQHVKVGVEKRLMADAREILRMEKEDTEMSDDEYSKQRRLLNADYQAGEFAFESERGKRYITTQRGALHLSSLLFQVDEAEMLRLMAARGPEVSALVDLVLRESFPFSPEQREALEKKAAAEKQSPPPTTPSAPRLW